MYLYEGLGALRLVAADSKSVGDSHQMGQRPGSHFSHHMAAMDLYSDLADAQFRRDPLVHESGSNED